MICRYYGKLEGLSTVAGAWLPPCTTKLRLLNVGCVQGCAGGCGCGNIIWGVCPGVLTFPDTYSLGALCAAGYARFRRSRHSYRACAGVLRRTCLPAVPAVLHTRHSGKLQWLVCRRLPCCCGLFVQSVRCIH